MSYLTILFAPYFGDGRDDRTYILNAMFKSENKTARLAVAKHACILRS